MHDEKFSNGLGIRSIYVCVVSTVKYHSIVFLFPLPSSLVISYLKSQSNTYEIHAQAIFELFLEETATDTILDGDFYRAMYRFCVAWFFYNKREKILRKCNVNIDCTALHAVCSQNQITKSQNAASNYPLKLPFSIPFLNDVRLLLAHLYTGSFERITYHVS